MVMMIYTTLNTARQKYLALENMLNSTDASIFAFVIFEMRKVK